MATAQEYFQITFDIYPVAWDESPFLYRSLNQARKEVALDVNLKAVEEIQPYNLTDKFFLTTSRPFLKIYFVVYWWRGNYKLYLKPFTHNPLPIKSLRLSYPLAYEPLNSKNILLHPTNYNPSPLDTVVIHYCPMPTDLNYLAMADPDLDDIYKYLVAWKLAQFLAINDAQYHLVEFFRTQYALERMRLLGVR